MSYKTLLCIILQTLPSPSVSRGKESPGVAGASQARYEVHL